MVCRSTPGMSIPLALAHLESGLDDAQVQSLVHQLRHEYAEPQGGHPPLSQADWDAYRGTLRERVTLDPNLRPQRRTGMLQRIDRADEAPPASMIYAAARIRERAALSARLLHTHLAREAARIALPDAEAQEIYDRARQSAASGRRERAGGEDQQRWPMLPLDPRTRDGLRALADRPSAPEVPLITQHQAVSWQRGDQSVTTVSHLGYHADSQRLEVIANGQVLAYRNISGQRFEQLMSARDTAQFEDYVRATPLHQYPTAGHAAAAGIRRRCSRCGQFCGAVHHCPGHLGGHRGPLLSTTPHLLSEPRRTQRLQGGSSSEEAETIAFASVAAQLNDHPDQTVEFPFRITDGATAITGSVQVVTDEQGRISVDTGFLSCGCPAFTAPGGCDHTRDIADRLRQTLEHTRQEWAEQQAAAAASAIAAAAPAETDEQGPEGPDTSAPATGTATTRPAVDALLPDAPNRCTFRYSDDPQRFAHDVRAILEQAETTSTAQAVPFMTGDAAPVLYGFGADRRFGLELEYDAADYGRMRSIPQHLYDAELTNTTQHGRYHEAGRRGYRETSYRGWSLEADSSVSGGELVSPILRDSPETWTRTSVACRTIVDNGGTASAGAGGHITVSAPDQAGAPIRLTRFLRLFRLHQDDLYTMSAAGYGRGSGHWARPMGPLPVDGYTRMGQIPLHDRYRAVNLQHVTTTSTNPRAQQSRIEFRLWDASLDPARIQTQVRMSTALLDYAEHDRSALNGFTDDSADTAGRIHPDDTQQLATQTQNLRELLDRLFRRDEDKRQVLALWATGLRNSEMYRTHH